MSGTGPTRAVKPWTQRASAPPSTPTTHAGAPSLSFNLRAASQFKALNPAPESSTKRSGLLADATLTFTQIKPSRISKGISARVCAEAANGKKNVASGSRRKRGSTQAFCNASEGISTRYPNDVPAPRRLALRNGWWLMVERGVGGSPARSMGRRENECRQPVVMARIQPCVVRRDAPLQNETNHFQVFALTGYDAVFGGLKS